MTTFLAILGLIVAVGAAWIGYLALKVSHQAQQDQQHREDRADAHDQLKWIEMMLGQVRRLQNAQGASDPEEFRDIQLSMRAALAIGGFKKRLPVTAILAERSFSNGAADGGPGWRPFLLTVDAARDELFDAAGAIGAVTSRALPG